MGRSLLVAGGQRNSIPDWLQLHDHCAQEERTGGEFGPATGGLHKNAPKRHRTAESNSTALQPRTEASAAAAAEGQVDEELSHESGSGGRSVTYARQESNSSTSTRDATNEKPKRKKPK